MYKNGRKSKKMDDMYENGRIGMKTYEKGKKKVKK